jgi:N-acetylglucosamine-6-phosphate deacetylase
MNRAPASFPSSFDLARRQPILITLRASRLFTPTEEVVSPVVQIEDGRIVHIGSGAASAPSGRELNFPDGIIVPGFVDLHIHGGMNVDVMSASPADFARLGGFLASHGVTAYLPTTVAAPMNDTCRALEHLADAIEDKSPASTEPCARPLGIHLEGPFLSDKRCGVHRPENLRPPTLHAFDQFWRASRGHLRMMTIAPELPGAFEVIAAAAGKDVLVSIGHSDADSDAARVAIAAGARHATHTFNAMRPLDHREPGILGETLTNSALSADIIADGIHVAPSIVQLFFQMKGRERSVLITDATSATGMPNGRYKLGTMEVEVRDGKCTIDGKLAGSVLTMDAAVRNGMRFASLSLQQAVCAATLNPARVAGLAQGVLSPGAEANLVILSPRGEVIKTIAPASVT